jgi:hypothetical protein
MTPLVMIGPTASVDFHLVTARADLEVAAAVRRALRA